MKILVDNKESIVSKENNEQLLDIVLRAAKEN